MSTSDALKAQEKWQRNAAEESENSAVEQNRPKSPSISSNHSEARTNYHHMNMPPPRRNFHHREQNNYGSPFNRRGNFNNRGKNNRGWMPHEFFNNYNREHSLQYKGNHMRGYPPHYNQRQMFPPQPFKEGFHNNPARRNIQQLSPASPHQPPKYRNPNGSMTSEDETHAHASSTVRTYRAAGTAPSVHQYSQIASPPPAFSFTYANREGIDVATSELVREIKSPVEKSADPRSSSRDSIHIEPPELSMNHRLRSALHGLSPGMAAKPVIGHTPIQSTAEALHTMHRLTPNRLKNLPVPLMDSVSHGGINPQEVLSPMQERMMERAEYSNGADHSDNYNKKMNGTGGDDVSHQQHHNYNQYRSSRNHHPQHPQSQQQQRNEELFAQKTQQIMISPNIANRARFEALNGNSKSGATKLQNVRESSPKCTVDSETGSVTSEGDVTMVMPKTPPSTTTLRNGIKPPPPPTSVISQNGQFQLSHMDVLSEKIWHYHNKVSQTEEMLSRKLHLRDKLYAAISPVFPMCGLYVVGSSLNGFGNNSSDMDLCLMITNKELDQKTDAVVVLNLIMTKLQIERLAVNQKLILAKVPILRIQFADPFADITVDLNANNYVAIKNTHLLCYYSSYDWRVRPLVSVVKEWAKRKGINDANKSSFTSYSLVLMVIHYLQCGLKPAVLPNLQKLYPERFANKCDVRSLNVTMALEKMSMKEGEAGKEDGKKSEMAENETASSSSVDTEDSATLGELLIGFLDYYANKFNYEKDAISIRQGQLIERAAVTKPKNVYSGNDTPPPSSSASSSSLYAGNGNPNFPAWRAQWRCVCIEEPFTTSNTAHSIYDEIVFGAIKTAFREAHQELEQNHDLDRLLDCQPISASVMCPGATVYEMKNGDDKAAPVTYAPPPPPPNNSYKQMGGYCPPMGPPMYGGGGGGAGGGTVAVGNGGQGGGRRQQPVFQNRGSGGYSYNPNNSNSNNSQSNHRKSNQSSTTTTKSSRSNESTTTTAVKSTSTSSTSSIKDQQQQQQQQKYRKTVESGESSSSSSSSRSGGKQSESKTTIVETIASASEEGASEKETTSTATTTTTTTTTTPSTSATSATSDE